MTAPLNAHRAVYERLTAELAGICEVYDDAPPWVEPPYVEFVGQDAARTAAGEPGDWSGFETTIFLAIAAGADALAAGQLVRRVAAAFATPLPGHRCRVIEAETLPAEPGQPFCGAVTLQLLTQET